MRLIGFLMAAWRSFKAERAQYFPAGGPSTPLRHWTKRVLLVLGGGMVISLVPFLGYVMWLLGPPMVVYCGVLGWRVFRAGPKISGTLILVAALLIAPPFIIEAPSDATAVAIIAYHRVFQDMSGSPVVVSSRWAFWGGDHLVVSNITNASLVPTSCRLLRPYGKVFTFNLPPFIPPNSTVEVRCIEIIPLGEAMDKGALGRYDGAGDVIELHFKGYDRPVRTEFR